MRGIDLNRPILYDGASLRYFKPNEHHVTRVCKRDVLVMVFDGVLRFSEDGTEYEICAGEYFIQKRGGAQSAPYPSDSPKYFYVHFEAEWTNGESALSRRGRFDYDIFRPLMEALDSAYHKDEPYIRQAALFYQILSLLPQKETNMSQAARIADHISQESKAGLTLSDICREFHFSKNHIINLFKKEYGVTPVVYMNNLKLARAESLLEITSDEIETIAYNVGFSNYSHFYRLFYRKNGVSPKKWREMKRV